MLRVTALAMAVFVMIGGGLVAWTHSSETERDALVCRVGLCEATAPTTATEPTNPFGWSDLAESRAANGEMEKAREAFAQSVRLGPNIPPILIRVVNFEVANGELDHAVPALRHILELTALYDSLVFRYLSRSSLGAERVLHDVIPDPGTGSAIELARRAHAARGHASAPDGDGRPRGEAARAWVAYLIAERRPEADTAMKWLQGRGGVTAELRNQWIENLVQVRRLYQQAVDIWADAQQEPGYPSKNRLYDGRFVRERTGGRMDWNLSVHAHVATKIERGLTLTFDGMENTAYSHLTQQAFVPAGRWRFTADVDAKSLTTDQRPYFRIFDTFDARRLDICTPMAPERMAVDFVSPESGSWVSVSLLRRQSVKFDNKILGTLHLQDVKITKMQGRP